jgi:hypothetical protein
LAEPWADFTSNFVDRACCLEFCCYNIGGSFGHWRRPEIAYPLRLAADVVNAIRATGKGYNACVEKELREALAKGKL